MHRFVLLIIGVVVASHQIARLLLFPLAATHGGIIEVASFFNLVEVWNHGVSFGIFKGMAYGQWLLSGLSLIITAALLFLLSRTKDRFSIAAYSLVIGGAIGNVIDRLRFGAVADYLDFHLSGYHWPAFNVTDMAIVSGVFLLLAVHTWPEERAINSRKPIEENAP